MEITFLGHQTWLIGDQKTNIIVDPLLTETFGTSREIQFRVFPPRSINLKDMPDLSGIFITNEHLDHFHLPSLKLLDNSIPVYVGRVMPDCVKETIKNLGFELHELCNSESIVLGGLKIRFYIGHSSAPFWEKRCYQLYATDEYDVGVFIQSDTLINDFFINQVENRAEPCPKIFIATNNSQVLPMNRYGAFDNLLPLDNHAKQGSVGINILEETLVQYPNKLSNINNILLSGSGYIIDNDDSIPFLYTDIEKVNYYLDELSLGTKAAMLYPGEKISYDKVGNIIGQNKVSWVKVDMSLYNKFKLRWQTINSTDNSLLKQPIFEMCQPEEFIQKHKNLLNKELKMMAKYILLSKLGKLLLSINEYLDGPLDSKRLIINFKINDHKSLFFELDINSASFKDVIQNENDLLRKYPFGITVYLSDFIAILTGKIQIWELATANMRQWYLGDKLTSPVAYLYSHFSEQVRPDLAYKVYETLNA